MRFYPCFFFFFKDAQYYLEVCKCYNGTVNSDICLNISVMFFFFKVRVLTM